jgi:hypothetical protein
LVSGPKIPVSGAVRLFEVSYAVVAVGFNHGMAARMEALVTSSARRYWDRGLSRGPLSDPFGVVDRVLKFAEGHCLIDVPTV